jgi:carboxylesterase type B
MLDLTMALQWVYDNIYAFNGNKDLITVYGPGAGAAAAGLLAVAPKSRHMVRQVFGQVSLRMRNVFFREFDEWDRLFRVATN